MGGGVSGLGNPGGGRGLEVQEIREEGGVKNSCHPSGGGGGGGFFLEKPNAHIFSPKIASKMRMRIIHGILLFGVVCLITIKTKKLNVLKHH